MNRGQKFFIFLIMLLVTPFITWFFALAKLQGIVKPNTFAYLKYAFNETLKLSDWRLMLAFLGGIVLAVLLGWLFDLFEDNYFKGKPYKKWLRGTKIVSPSKLKSLTTERKKQQVRIGNIPIPTKLEPLHFLLNGATGTGKSVIITNMILDILKRPDDRMIIIDPNGEMFSKFGKKGDVLLNPFDARTKGWNIFNEINKDYDFDKRCKSIVPVGKDANSEQWNSYARVLLKAAMQYEQGLGGVPSMRNVQDMIALKETKELKKMLAGTDAMTLFVEGADRALGSAKFTLGDRLPPYKLMPEGDFSIVDFLQDDKKGNLFITWREEQTESLRPLISAWADIIMSTVLSLPPSSKRSIWLFLDELASLDALSSLNDAVEKGRKHGLRIVAGLQTISQFRDIYGKDLAQTIMGSLRNLVVLGGSKSDAETAETMSKSLGEHEVIRENKQKNTKVGSGTTITESTHKESVVMPAEIAGLPILHSYISFAGDLPITKVVLKYNNFKIVNSPFVES